MKKIVYLCLAAFVSACTLSESERPDELESVEPVTEEPATSSVTGEYGWYFEYYADATYTEVVGGQVSGCDMPDPWGTFTPYYRRYRIIC
jgi:hypothetical protein